MKTLYILGAGGHGKVVFDIADCMAQWDQIVFLDDAWPTVNQVMHITVKGPVQTLQQSLGADDDWIVAVGNNRLRERWLAAFSGLKPATILTHPQAVVSRYARLQAGTVVMPGAIVNAGCVVGIGAILNTACSIDHDCHLATAVHICPGARLGGDVRVGNRSWVGIGSTVKHGICIADDVMVGAGATVVKNIESGQVVTGTPARTLHQS